MQVLFIRETPAALTQCPEEWIWAETEIQDTQMTTEAALVTNTSDPGLVVVAAIHATTMIGETMLRLNQILRPDSNA